jgi:glycosyltransferase involved in cell wall biosynthesis
VSAGEASLAVLITYHNERGLLRECIESLSSQRYGPDEILVYDDASTFPPAPYVPTGAFVRVVTGAENHGPAYGRNILLRESRCEYVHCHDADDLFHPDWCREVRAVIEREHPDIVLTEIASVREGFPVSDAVLGLDRLSLDGDLVRFGLEGSLLVPSTTFRRELALRIGAFRTREVLQQSEDFDFHIRLAAAAQSRAVIRRPLIVQRLRADSHSADLKSCWTSARDAIALLSKDLPDTYQSDLASASARVGSELFAIGEHADARNAYRLARRLGAPSFLHRPASYRIVARIFGQEAAEWIGVIRQKLVRLRFRRQDFAS